jgi:hypothetical protein
MKRISSACLVAVALLLGPLQLTAAQTAKFRHLVSIYADDQAVGLSVPEGVGCGANGQIVVGDTGNNRLVRFTYLDKTISGGTVIQLPQLPAPSRVQLNSKGEIYVLDSKERRLVHLSPEGEFRETLTAAGAPPPTTIVPKSFTIDSADNIYVLDVFSARVLVLNAQGAFVRALALPDDIGFASDLALDESGGLFVVDAIKRQLFLAGKDATAFAPVGGDLTEALATAPTSMTVSKGSIFITEGSGGSIVSFRRDGTFVARQLTPGWDEGMLRQPSQMCINDKDEVFIADRDNSRIQVFQLIR